MFDVSKGKEYLIFDKLNADAVNRNLLLKVCKELNLHHLVQKVYSFVLLFTTFNFYAIYFLVERKIICTLIANSSADLKLSKMGILP